MLTAQSDFVLKHTLVTPLGSKKVYPSVAIVNDKDYYELHGMNKVKPSFEQLAHDICQLL